MSGITIGLAYRQTMAFVIVGLSISVSPGSGATARGTPDPSNGALQLPWREAGLTQRQAAAHLLDRFAYGARPGDVDSLVDTGVEVWLAHQLTGNLPDPEVDRRLRNLHSLGLSTREMVETYPNPGTVMREAARAGVIDGELSREDMEGMAGGRSRQRRQLMDFASDRGYRPSREMIGEMMVNKLARARYSENQLTEVLTDFWFNHFNVSITDNETRQFIGTYERDAVRPYVLGSFRDMLEATAKHPAMLLYLDNARSVAENDAPRTFDRERYQRTQSRRGGFGRGRFGGLDTAASDRRPQGLNENYARELMELHTLGVDGGYTQDDVIAVARAFTGWTTYPPGPERREVESRIERARRIPGAGFVFEAAFIFRADAHDAGEKTILGETYPAGRGIEDGLDVLDALAAHPSTARHIATKLAVRFVGDQPPATLIDRLAARFQSSRGDLRQVVRSLAESPEFWSAAARRAKIKSPFELAVSSLRILDVEIEDPRSVLEWIWRMGQPLYAYQAPTGYPDRAAAWVNTGSLLHRMNFGLQLATGRLAGLDFDLADLNGHREPESLVDALATYVPLLMPERDPEATIRRLEPMIHDPELAKKITQASPETLSDPVSYDWSIGPFGPPSRDRDRDRRRRRDLWPRATVDNSPLAHVVGVILGSPEFQRR